MTNMQEKSIDFVNMIELYPCLYDFTISSYSRPDLKEKAWEDIAEKMGDSVSVCKERWKNIRTVFLRHLKQKKSTRTSTGFKRKYYLEDAMQFMLPFMKSRTKADDSIFISLDTEDISNDDEVFNDNNSELSDTQNNGGLPQTDSSHLDVSATELHHQNKRIKRESESYVENFEATRKHTVDTEGADRHFLLSLLPDMQEMTAEQKRKFKIEVLNVISRMLDNSLAQHH